MKRWQAVIGGIGLLTVLLPTVGQAQPAGRTKSGEMARGLFLPVVNAVWFPVKFGTGVAGAVLGGVSGFMTGGNERAAQGIWRPMTGGTYFITPEVWEGERPFLPFNYGPTPSAYGTQAEPTSTPNTRGSSAGLP
jgi:hypothetical protein